MIVNFIITGLLGLVDWIASFLPAGSPWAPDASIVAGVLGNVYAINAYVPVDEAFVLLAIATTVLNAKFFFHIVTWIYRKIRGSG